MSLESDIFDCIKSLTANRCYPDLAPAATTTPYTVYQQVGGRAWNYLETAMHPKRHARVQVSCWATTRAAASALARSAEQALVQSTTLRSEVIGAMVAVYEHDTNLYGTHQHFGIQY